MGQGGLQGRLMDAADAYVARLFPDRARRGESLSRRGRARMRWNPDYCRGVACSFDRAPHLAYDSRLSRLYHRFKCETRRQYDVIRDAGITVEPWVRPGQPYRDSGALRAAVLSTGILYVYLTDSGHGAGRTGYHPMLATTGISVRGVEFRYNDVFRAVHDVFGHVMFGNDFSARGEFRAAFCHMGMYTPEIHPVLFTEQVAQISWYYFGPHLKRGEPRRYPDQKVFRFPPSFLDEFRGMFVMSETGSSGQSL
ncbi:crotonobetainyl-CoA--carnitine CoA-transferase [Amycolatopsis rhizosphaerae]|uniref:Crotonobetainyl-CoA--carnitine CoA-transferase n=1 Tax=Amycolatopsis rhizosphaerae TaxID=2053003 RepID=A0A558CB11_9PSEU|nr:crotonobetainyl-CoA--carnitine CoA-transferase [Amycolatopsis rhizosphaerae]TVT45969.1 crotonobetainyl-CoA--carnitine CoA-transferase [Amycolatopsis rhizosphaerae]